VGIQFPAVWASGLGVIRVAVDSGCHSDSLDGLAFNPVPPSPAGEGTLSSCSQRGVPQLCPSLYGPCGRLAAPQADGQQSDQLPPPGDVLVCFAPWDASLGLRIFAHDPGNRLMPTLTAGARSIRTLFPGSRLIASGPTCEVRGGAESLRATFDIDIAGTVRSLVHSS
jgi:hypothetical protein